MGEKRGKHGNRGKSLKSEDAKSSEISRFIVLGERRYHCKNAS